MVARSLTHSEGRATRICCRIVHGWAGKTGVKDVSEGSAPAAGKTDLPFTTARERERSFRV